MLGLISNSVLAVHSVLYLCPAISSEPQLKQCICRRSGSEGGIAVPWVSEKLGLCSSKSGFPCWKRTTTLSACVEFTFYSSVTHGGKPWTWWKGETRQRARLWGCKPPPGASDLQPINPPTLPPRSFQRKGEAKTNLNPSYFWLFIMGNHSLSAESTGMELEEAPSPWTAQQLLFCGWAFAVKLCLVLS